MIVGAAAGFGPVVAQASTLEHCLGTTPLSGVVARLDEGDLHLGDGTILKLAAIRPSRDVPSRLASGDVVVYRPVSERRDRRGRLHAFVAAEGRLLQQEHIARGETAVMPSLPFRDSAIDDTCWLGLFVEEEQARNAGTGIWAGTERVFRVDDPRLAERIGRFTIVAGRVLSVGDRRRNSYLNFGRFWSEDFTVVVPDSVRDSWGIEAVAPRFDGRRIRVRGFMESRGGPMILIEHPAQIEVLPLPETSG